MSATQQTWWLFGGVFAILIFASTVGWLLQLRAAPGHAGIANLNARIKAWWVIVGLIGFAFLFGRVGVIVLFGLVSFFALREFITLTPSRPGDHLSLFLSFFVIIPSQYALIGTSQYGVFAIFIPPLRDRKTDVLQLANFFLDDMFAYQAKIVIPSTEVQKKIADVLVAGHGGRFHEPRYNLVAYPFATRYQNSNQWLLETLAGALAEGQIGTRGEAQAWLRASGFRPSTLHLPAVERLGARVFRVNVAFDDQPIDRRMAGNIDVVSAESVLDFVLRVDPGATARVIEVDRGVPGERLP